MKKIAFPVMVMILIFVMTAAFAACDPRGSLSDEETRALYTEIKADLENESIWTRRIEVPNAQESNDETVAFVKASLELLRGSAPESLYGWWFNSKSYARFFSAEYNTEIAFEGHDYEVKAITVAKYKSGDVDVSVRYSSEDSEEKTARIVIK
ncbi:MAG: hypothetical protein J5772_02860 [Clostridia bacterium]|nr:hypothetical protein [Clostridia bacterium]